MQITAKGSIPHDSNLFYFKKTVNIFVQLKTFYTFVKLKILYIWQRKQ